MFQIKIHFPDGNEGLTISGNSLSKINLIFAKLTGGTDDGNEGPEICYKNNTLSLIVGVELFGERWFVGTIGYNFMENVFEGSLRYEGNFLWIEKPTLNFLWSKTLGFKIKQLEFLDVPFAIMRLIKKFSCIAANIMAHQYVSLGWNTCLTTQDNPDPSRYLVKLVLNISITIIIVGEVCINIFPLPDLPLLIRNVV